MWKGCSIRKENETEMVNKVSKKSAKSKEPATELMKRVAERVPNSKTMRKAFSEEEIEEIEEKLKNRQKGELDAEKNKLERIKYRKIKRRVKEMEIGNNSRVIFFPSMGGGGWYKAVEFSALYYMYRLADRMGRGGSIKPDSDSHSKVQFVASLQDIEKFAKQFEELAHPKLTITTEGVYIFELKKPLSDDEVGMLRQTEETRRERTHNVLKPKAMSPATYQAILMLVRQVLPRVRKLEKQYYRVVGENLARDIVEVMMVYFCYADKVIDAKTAGSRLIAAINKILAGVAILSETRVWQYEVAVAIGENANNLKRIILKEFKIGEEKQDG